MRRIISLTVQLSSLVTRSRDFYTVRLSASANLPMNFGGIEDEGLSSFENARVVVWPVSYEGTVSYGAGTGAGAEAIVDASRNMELYDEETDAEVYRLGIHTTEVTP